MTFELVTPSASIVASPASQPADFRPATFDAVAGLAAAAGAPASEATTASRMVREMKSQPIAAVSFMSLSGSSVGAQSTTPTRSEGRTRFKRRTMYRACVTDLALR